MKEIADAYNFTHVGTEQIQGRDIYVIAAEPRPELRAASQGSCKFLAKIRGRIWVDATSKIQWV